VDRDEALRLLTGGPDEVVEWNTRRANGEAIPRFFAEPNLFHANLREANLSEANLIQVNLGEANLSEANLREANLIQANLSGADLSGADLSGARFNRANCNRANLSRANLSGADLIWANLSIARLNMANLNMAELNMADLRGADLSGANLSGARLIQANLIRANLSIARLNMADLRGANLSGANLSGANLTQCRCQGTAFANIDLSTVHGLESVIHDGPSTVGIDTIIESQGKIPEEFLRGCGVPDAWIVQIPALIGAMEPIQFYSCFISYSTKDDEFARRLHARMVQENLRVWFAPEDVQGGKKLHEQIDEAIRIHDKLLIVLSTNSMGSEWVMTEIRKARKAERKEGKRKLFPIRLVDFATIRDWECFDADNGKDLAVEIREYFIPDFANWKDHDAFEAAFARLMNDLKAEGTPAK
jgi:uncharacterized protein YjbI with pentapeptide repeats